ncbi:hypothetical protein ACIA8G_35485 [Lentzea sp. NPDC051213]|uniref:hypothetical protein n=1 Tax=Lentzea sp. NPDC051213 TaxID=3364126 RepID=UPI003793C2E1
MSWVANLMLSVSGWDNSTAAELSEWLRTDAPRRDDAGAGCGFLALITDQDSRWGGWKNPECHVWAGALNHADLDALVAHVGKIDWKVPLAVQMLIMDQEEGFFRLWMFRGGEFRQYAPLQPDDDDPAFFPVEV